MIPLAFHTWIDGRYITSGRESPKASSMHIYEPWLLDTKDEVVKNGPTDAGKVGEDGK